MYSRVVLNWIVLLSCLQMGDPAEEGEDDETTLPDTTDDDIEAFVASRRDETHIVHEKVCFPFCR